MEDDVPKIVYIEADGARHIVEVPIGLSVMRGALDYGVPGILAECGGSCSCGTCRVHIDEAWSGRVGSASELEEATMEGHDDPHPNKRLSCQILVDTALDGLVVHLPKSQL
jgi:2Fe-2S ferredoxin